MLGLEIDVREWGLGNFSDNARDISQVVWKILEDNNVAGGKGFRAGRGNKASERFLLIHGLVGGAGEEIVGLDCMN